MGRGFSHDVSALDYSGVLTPDAPKCHFSAACRSLRDQFSGAISKWVDVRDIYRSNGAARRYSWEHQDGFHLPI